MDATPIEPASKPPARSVGQLVAKAVVGTSATQLVVIVAAFVASITQARLLGAEGRGEVTRFANAGALAVMYFGFGISSAVTYFVASGGIEPRALARTLRRAFVVTTLLVIACAAAATVTPARRFLPEVLSDGGVVAALATYFAFSQLNTWLSALLSARGAFTPINFGALAVNGSSALVSSCLLWLRPPWADAVAIIGLSIALEGVRAVVLATGWLRKPLQAPVERAATGGAAAVGFGELARYSFLSYVGDSVQFMTYRFDMWVVDAFRGAADLGRYSLAVSLAQLVWVVPTAAAQVLFPYSAMIDRRQGVVLAWRTARICFLVCALAAVAGLIASHLLLTWLVGPEFAELSHLIGILLLGIVPYSIARVLSNYLAGINEVASIVRINVVGLALVVGLDIAFIPALGATGAAWATAVSYILYTLLMIGLFARKNDLRWRALLSLRLRLPS